MSALASATTPASTQAPGKLILLGEYAVLAGHPCLVVAVDRHATCTVEARLDAPLRVEAGRFGAVERRGGHTAPGEALPLVRALLEGLSEAGISPPEGLDCTLDSEALHADTPDGRQKLGLGSSASTTVALAGALLARAGRPLPFAPKTRDLIYRLAQSAHRAVQGTGSGADIAASTYGGVQAYAWFDDAGEAPESARLVADGACDRSPLAGGPTRVHAVWTGRSASTVKLVGGVHRWRDGDPVGYRRRIAGLGEAAAAGIAAWRADDREALAEAATLGFDAIDALGRDAGVELVTATHRDLARRAAEFGAVIKPTGAGGGDLAWLVAADPEAERAAAHALSAAGVAVFDYAVDPQGVG